MMTSDMYFRFGDELYLPQLCNVMPGYDKCDGGTGKYLLTNNLIVEKLVVETNGVYGMTSSSTSP